PRLARVSVILVAGDDDSTLGAHSQHTRHTRGAQSVHTRSLSGGLPRYAAGRRDDPLCEECVCAISHLGHHSSHHRGHYLGARPSPPPLGRLRPRWCPPRPCRRLPQGPPPCSRQRSPPSPPRPAHHAWQHIGLVRVCLPDWPCLWCSSSRSTYAT